MRGPKDFLLHDCILKGHMIQNRRLDAECFPIEVSTMHNLFLVNQPKNPVKMFFVDDFTVFGFRSGCFPYCF